MSRGSWVVNSAVVLGLFLVPPPVRCEDLLGGTAKVDITPPIGFPLWGYAARHDQPSTGVRDPLHARVVVLGVGKDKLAIVSLDLGRAPSRAVTESIHAASRNTPASRLAFWSPRTPIMVRCSSWTAGPIR